MKIKLLAHSTFLIISKEGSRIVMDPFTPGFMGFEYRPISESADVVTVSHGHGDHDNVSAIGGSPRVFREAGQWKVKEIELKGVQTYHDEARGAQRGENIIFRVVVDGIRVCHLGDLGHRLDSDQRKALGSIDILMIPVGGVYTIDAPMAHKVCVDLGAKIIFPMHFKTSKAGGSLATVDAFIRGRNNVRQIDSSEIEIEKKDLPETSQIVLLKPAL
jgi:L-ascorbate metabolism protein UlaG (beta-lactamase superfamily)